jgi:hypothetical protein
MCVCVCFITEPRYFTYFRVRHGRQLSGTLFLRLTTRNCSSGERPPEEEVVAEAGVGVMLTGVLSLLKAKQSFRSAGIRPSARCASRT